MSQLRRFLPRAACPKAAAITMAFLAVIACACLAPPAFAVTTATLTVNAGQTVRIVDNRILGLNTAIWDNYATTLGYPYVVTLLQATNTGSMRYPGGSSSDYFNWQDSSLVAQITNTTLPDYNSPRQ